MYNKVIADIKQLGFMWETADPFIFCVHHLDAYPAGNDALGPDAPLEGRNIGQDFTVKDGWRMYHGDRIPGFPVHPHRGFETVTVVLNGLVDHADSHGAAGRYGNGDVQWMTAGAGLQHSEMFPLLRRDAGNPLELFQIWINLPAARKFAKPHYAMLWSEDIPTHRAQDDQGKTTEVRLVSGSIGEASAPPPAPDSWARDPKNGVAIWLVHMEAGARWALPAALPDMNRTLYYYRASAGDGESGEGGGSGRGGGSSKGVGTVPDDSSSRSGGGKIRAAGIEIPSYRAVELLADQEVILENGALDSYCLLLQGRPINEPVSHYGPFVMNTPEEIQQAISDYRSTRFGGWPWPRDDMVHGSSRGRFAHYADGREETRD